LCAALAYFGASRKAAPGAEVQGDRPASAKSFSFEEDIRPLLQSKCWRCHGEKTHKAGLDLTSAPGILKGGESGPALVPGKPDESLLYEKIHSGAMPPNKKDRLQETEVTLIRRWIEAGAQSHALLAPSTEPAVTQHDVVPVLLRRCAPCHGAHRQEAGLDLRTKNAMLHGGKSGPAVVPGNAEESLLIKKVRTGQMPPRSQLVEASVKLIEPAEIDLLARWIAAGMPEAAQEPDVAQSTPDSLVTDQDRDFWAFRPPHAVTVPEVRESARVRNPIDAFILQKLEQNQLSLAREAEPSVLIRRAYFDLTGLPPEPAEVQAFVTDRAVDAYERMIDRLLASPRYGERWGRHWLDLAGYADSEGKREQDLPRPYAWRYRDYVIRAFNTDKPYDRFLLEQIAGDELADYESAPEITPELYDNLVATGFLRMASDPTWANITGFVADRLEVMADEMDVLGSVVLGLTLKCARCHSHKFDPIPQRDYYRLVDVFKGAFDEYDWLKPDVKPGLGPISQDPLGGRHLPYVTTVERRAWEADNAKIQREIDSLQLSLDQKVKNLSAKHIEERLTQWPESLREDVRKTLTTPPDKRDTVQRYLAEKFEKQLRFDRDTLRTLDPAFKRYSDETEKQLRALQAQRLPEPRIQALWDRGQASPTYIYRRGDPQSPGRRVGPGVPSVLTDGKTPFEVKPPWPGAKKTGRRLAFARWLTQPNQPLTARVAVNRLWKQHFGAGIVPTLGNFGKAGALPTHPELLDWLALEFVRQGWSIKTMHRLMMTSSTYCQGSAVTPASQMRDPSNAMYSRMPLVRLDAESLYDALLLVAGRLNERPFGTADAVQVRRDGLVTPVKSEGGYRRLIYVRQARKQMVTHLENFDFPQMSPNCISRRDSTVAPQALYLMNNGMVQQLSEQFARRICREAGADLARQIERVYLVALSRLPTDEEMKFGTDALNKLIDEWTRAESSAAPDRSAAELKALTSYCHAIMNSANFLYID
jgi:mono/diheme cytochrome c family protein